MIRFFKVIESFLKPPSKKGRLAAYAANPI